MSFVVEIPSIFTKPTQIPVRLGNTILSGNETIQGALQVNGSLTLNVGSNVDNTNVVYYDSLDISNALSVGGTATIGGTLSIPNFADVGTAIGGKQPTIDSSVSVSCNTLTTAGTATIGGTLSIPNFADVGTAISGKQDDITVDTDLILNSITTTDLEVNGSLKLDKKTFFDTLVLKRLTLNGTSYTIGLKEIQCWVNGTNILFNNSANLISSFVNWNNKNTIYSDTDVESYKAYNNIFENDIGAQSSGIDIALIIKNIPLTLINTIQTIVFYSRKYYRERAVGLIFELYNSVLDPNLTQVLATTDTIPSAQARYRFDFPAFSTYTGGFNTGDSISQITSGATEIATNVLTFLTEITGDVWEDNLSITGDLTITGTLTNSGLTTALEGKQATITTTTALSSKSLTTDDLIVNNTLNIDTRKYFDTIVIRRPTGTTGEAGDFFISLRELQVWVNASNLLLSAGITAIFADWAVDKEVAILERDPAGGVNFYAVNIFNEDITEDFDVESKENQSTADIALIISNIPLTLIESIQALVLYNRNDASNLSTIGLAIELYNSTKDPTLTEILATTDEITTAEDVYRFDFPSISTYSGFSASESTSEIMDITPEVVSVSARPTEMEGGLSVDDITTTGNATIGGDLVVNGVINQTGASWSLGGFDDGVSVSLAVTEDENMPFSVKQSAEVNCVYNDTDDTITIQKAGKYFISYGAMTQNNSNTAEIFLRKNDVNVINAYSSGSGFRQVSRSIILDLNVDDNLSVFVNAGVLHASEQNRYFIGSLIG